MVGPLRSAVRGAGLLWAGGHGINETGGASGSSAPRCSTSAKSRSMLRPWIWAMRVSASPVAPHAWHLTDKVPSFARRTEQDGVRSSACHGQHTVA